MEPRKSNELYQKALDLKSTWVADSFRGTAYAIRREVFLSIGGFREQIIGQNEEPDFCIRLLNRGFVIALGSGDNVVHCESPKRDWRRQDFYGRRNDVLFAWRNVPMPFFPLHLLATTANGLKHAIRTQSISNCWGLLSGYAGIISDWHTRLPVSRKTYRLHRLLKARQATKLSDIEERLPSLIQAGPDDCR